jgi:hypothetical protein
MAIGILDFRYPKKRFCRLADSLLSDAIWPLGEPENGETFGDLAEHDHLVLEIRSRSLLANRRGLQCRVSALMVEPPEIHLRYYRFLRLIGGKYHRVLTHNTQLIQRLPNARFYPHGGCWLNEIPSVDAPRTGRVSMIASKKRYAIGHKLRHTIAEWATREAPDLALFGSGYQPLANKAEGISPFHYSVVIENSREPGYFTEKLIDCLLCRSLPIYWGAPDIAHFFDLRGMIVCNSEKELQTAISDCNASDYAKRLPYLEENRTRALQYTDINRNAALTLQREDEFSLQAA